MGKEKYRRMERIFVRAVEKILCEREVASGFYTILLYDRTSIIILLTIKSKHGIIQSWLVITNHNFLSKG